VNTNSKLPEICKEAFAQAREKRSLTTKDLGGMACLSHRQIEQIENGEASSFYGAQNKLTAAKKVAKILELSDEDAFEFAVAPSKLSAKKEVPAVNESVEEAPVPELAIKEEKKELIKKREPKKVASKEVPFPGTSTSSKPASSKKLFLWLSVLAALVFSVINLRPLFFADKPEEIIVVKEEIIEPVPTPAEAPVEPAPAAAPVVVAAAPAIATDAPGACPAEEGIISFKPEAPRKPADLVYLLAKSKQTVCVIDVSGKIQNKLLEPGVGASFYGKPPFKVLTTGLNQVDVFFQGAKVRLSNPNSKTLILEATEVATPPADRTDSQLR
jgi:transcriptional regulator with XRE-family HTH domain